MLLRLRYACACSNKWEIVHHDNHYGECLECVAKSWPVEMFEIKPEKEFTLCNDVMPWRPSPKGYEGFEKVAQTVLPRSTQTKTKSANGLRRIRNMRYLHTMLRI
jgi:hypothetical protein